jgi:cytochrome c-type biogenesis protein CcmH
MALWLVLALMTAAALAAIALPFVRRDEIVPSGSDVAVYKDQLAEIDRDREAGLIGNTDAEAARVEVSRRLLQAAEVSDTDHPFPLSDTKMRMRRRATFVVSLVFLPILAAGVYLRLGSPTAALAESTADEAALSSDEAVVDAMVTQVEGYLKDTPNDGRGWETLAPVYMRLGRYDDAVRAWQNTIANLGDNADREENLGESLVAAADGVVTKEAKRAFDQSLSMDPNNVASRFYTGLAAKQAGRRDAAAEIWRGLIAKAPPDAEWADTVRDALARLDEPSAATADGAQPSDNQQAAIIRSMVDGLAERLKIDGQDLEGWLRLVHSYNVLGDPAKANTAIADARTALAHDPNKLAQFESSRKSADLPTESTSRRDPAGPISTNATSPEHENVTMRAMVEKLAQRLRSQGGDVDSWFMLVRSYETLGERDKALTTIARARLAFASDPERLSQLDQLLRGPEGVLGQNPATALPGKPEAQKPLVADAGSAEQQMTIIKGMVDRLAQRLAHDGHDVDGWTRLMRSYVVLGERDLAAAAGQRARVALSNDAGALRQLDAAAKELGVDLP